MLIRVSVLAGVIFIAALSAGAAWTPSSSPVPSVVLREAQEDFRNQQYEDALDRHVWYHDNALKFDPGQTGVRLSFALSSWIELGKVYPPALAKLKSIQDGLEKELNSGQGTFEKFHELSSINRTFGETKRTTATFVILDAKNSALAKRTFHAALPALVQSQEYALCGKYIQADKAYESAVQGFRITSKYEAGNPNPVVKQTNFAKRSFSNASCTLVALLVKNNRLEEAKKVATDAATELDDKDFKAELEKALKGEVPAPWP